MKRNKQCLLFWGGDVMFPKTTDPFDFLSTPSLHVFLRTSLFFFFLPFRQAPPPFVPSLPFVPKIVPSYDTSRGRRTTTYHQSIPSMPCPTQRPTFIPFYFLSPAEDQHHHPPPSFDGNEWRYKEKERKRETGEGV